MPQSPRLPRQPPVPPATPVRELCQDRHAAIVAALDQLTGGERTLTTIAVLGDHGLGKSRVVTALGAGAAARGLTVIPLQTGARYQEPFATVLSGLADLAPLLRPQEGPEDSEESEETRWRLALEILVDIAADRGLLLTIDDAQDMDEQSARFLAHVHRATTGGQQEVEPLIAVAMAVPDVDRVPGSLLRHLIKSQKTNYLKLEPLNQTDLAQLVGEIFSDASAPVRRALTRDLMHRSEGHPSVLDALLPLVDRATFTIDLGPPPSSPGAIEAAIAEANRSAIDGSFREAVDKLSALNGAPGIDLNGATRTLLANSLYRVGAYREADRLADDLVAEAIKADDHDAAFEAAILGLPEAEQHEGSDGRATRLLTVDPERLADEEARFRHAVITGRQLILAGRTDGADTWYRQAKAMASTADRLAVVFNLGWYLTRHETSPNQQAGELEALIEMPGLSTELELMLTEHLAISSYEAGQVDGAIAAMETVGRRAEASGDNIRWWHHLCLRNMLAFEQGRWVEAEQHRVEAMAHAQTNAIADGEHLYLAQKFNEAWVKGEQAIFAPMLDRVPPEIGRAWFGRVAMVEAFRAAGLLDDRANDAVRQDGITLVRRSIEHPDHRAMPALVYLSRFIAEEVEEPERSAVVELLARRSGSLLVYGVGTASFGPIDRYLFHISGDISHLERAIEVADNAGVPLWQVLLRVEHAAQTSGNSDLLLRQAEALSDGTDLTALL